MIATGTKVLVMLATLGLILMAGCQGSGQVGKTSDSDTTSNSPYSGGVSVGAGGKGGNSPGLETTGVLVGLVAALGLVLVRRKA